MFCAVYFKMQSHVTVSFFFLFSLTPLSSTHSFKLAQVQVGETGGGGEEGQVSRNHPHPSSPNHGIPLVQVAHISSTEPSRLLHVDGYVWSIQLMW